ncbi:ATP-binding protein [Leptolyngbya sp. UWPOB_LEPTO1]|uniref:ATP-binding protein n=1 Tax=Leptolyngbya sp. UWPOB_LEPTO1 TaxID=2815653 RepID=UPI0025808B4C|nr:ATP-binding protein [Leptolyngbya sp. UWPOB_LEPTO1]
MHRIIFLPKQSCRWLLLGAALSAIVAATAGIATLNAQSDKAAKHELELTHLQAVANRLDALEWRAIAKRKNTSELKEALNRQREQANHSLDALKTTASSQEQLQKVELAYQTYATAVNQLLKLLESNQIEKALEVDETQVDLSYEKLYESISNAAAEAAETTARLTFWANFGSLLIVLSLVSAFSLLFRRYLQVNLKMQQMTIENLHRREQTLEQERQLLESKVVERTEELQQSNIALSQTLSELQKSQIQLIQSEKMSTLGELVAGIAHEINNPIGFLSGNIQPALEYTNDLLKLIDLYQEEFPQPGQVIQEEVATIDLDYLREDLPKLIGSMKEGVDRIRDISTSLRTFSRSDSTSCVAFDVHAGIDSTLLILKHRLKANESRPEIEIIKEYGRLPSVECYAGQLNQVFMNLLSNAIDALEEFNQGRSFEEIKANPNRISVKTDLSNDSQFVVISIRDNGIGMTDQVKRKIFDPVFTTKEVGKGTGLGLAISHSIVIDKHGGSLEVNSVLGNGAEFIITVPVRTKPEACRVEPQA